MPICPWNKSLVNQFVRGNFFITIYPVHGQIAKDKLRNLQIVTDKLIFCLWISIAVLYDNKLIYTVTILNFLFFFLKFVEDEVGVIEDSAILPSAEDPLNDGGNLFYFIIKSINVEDASYFSLDPLTRILTVVNKMDRDSIETHTIKVLASRLSTWDETQDTYDEASTILITIHVCIKS